MECLTLKIIKMKNDYDKVRTSRNELEAILRIRGISKQRFGRILNIKGSTIEKYLDNPYHLRYYQMQRLSQFLNVGVKDIIDIIEIDLKDGMIIIQGEDNFSAVESLSSNKYE
jgi:predicted transcriptional regulator